MKQCDFGTTNGTFLLTDQDPYILGGQDPLDFQVRYFETLALAQAGVPGTEILGGVKIIDPPSPETIWARIEDRTGGGCYDLTDFEIYFSRAVAGAVSDRGLCDSDGDGGEYVDLGALFDVEVLDGQPSSDYTITYHHTQGEALAGTGAIASPYFVVAPGPETIWVRLENNDDPASCFDALQSFELRVDGAPSVNASPANLVECDDNNDGFAAFDLSLQTDVITLGNAGLSVSYHKTLVSAQSDTQELPALYVNDEQYLDAPVTDPLDADYGTGGVWARVVAPGSSCVAIVPFALEVRFSPVGTVPLPLRVCDDSVADGIARFDLTRVEAEVLGALDPDGFDLYYFEVEAQAVAAGISALPGPIDLSQAVPDPANYLNTNSPYFDEIFILVVSNPSGTIPPNPNSAEGCFDVVRLELYVDALPPDLGPFSLVLCDDAASGSTVDGVSIFDLTAIEGAVTNNDGSLSVAWFLSYADEAADIPIPDPASFRNTNTPQTIIGRVVSGRGCRTLVELTLEVLPNPSPNPDPAPLELCDSGPDFDDGIAEGWDLTLADADIIAGQADVTVAYYTTLALAEAGAPGTEIVMPFANTVPGGQTVYARVQLEVPPAVLACHTVVELQLVVVPAPMPPVSPPFRDPFVGCDESGSGTGIFDLTLQDAGLLAGNPDPSDFGPVLYYDTSFADALAGVPGTEIAAPGAYISAGGVPIWARVQSLSTGCVRVTEFQLELELFPAIGTGGDLHECDDLTLESTDTDGTAVFDLTVNTPLIQQGDPGLEVRYYASAVDQANDVPIAAPGSYRNVVPVQQRIFVTAFSGNGCRATGSFLAIVDPAAAAFSPGAMVACDSDNDGFALFDLGTQTALVTGGNPALAVSYHTTLYNAQRGLLPIAAPYENDVIYLDAPVTDPLDPRYGTGGVWVRVENDPAVNGCPRILSFALEVHFSPVAGEPAPLRECDLDGDGVEEFDLTLAAPDILGGLDPGAYDLYYYEDLADAQAAGDLALTAPDYSRAIAFPAAYSNTGNPQTLYVLVVGNANSTSPPNPNGGEGCYDIAELVLIVEPMPGDPGPFALDRCDDAVADGQAQFDLTVLEFQITGGLPGLSVTWFDSLGNPILDPGNYTNINTPETVVATVTSDADCSSTVAVTLTVYPNPAPNMDPAPLVRCDDDDDGVLVFDLNERTQEIRNGQDNVSVVYYETLALAVAGAPFTEIFGGIYENTRSPYNDTVFARVSNNVPPQALPCYTVVELDLEVVALPDRPDPATFRDPLAECDEDGDGDAVFDLSSQDGAVYGSQDPAGFAPIAYYEDEADAVAGNANFIDPAILGAYESVPRPIWVRLESLATGCARVTRFELVVGAFPGSGNADDLVLCDDEESGSNSDGTSVFDLTVNTPVITGNDPTLSVAYFASLGDLNNNIPIAAPQAYANLSNPQEIFYTVSGQNSCSDSQSFSISVSPSPQPVQPAPLVSCDGDGDGFSTFDLESKTAEIQGGGPSLAVTYHETLLDATTGDFPLSSPYANIVAYGQTLYVRAVFAAPPGGPVCYGIVTLELSVVDGPVVPGTLPDLVACGDGGTAVFDLTVQEALILGSPPQTDVTLTYHLSEADALAGAPFIVDPTIFTNSANPQTIWVRLESDLTGCFGIASFALVVADGLPITDPSPLELCDDLGQPNDGFTAFNLTLKNSEITNGVLTQGVSYFETEQDARDGVRRIDPETAYVNTSNPQVLYVRVEDSNSGCVSFTTLTIKVIPNPTPVAPDPIALCDYNVIVPPGPYDGVELFDLTVREGQILNGNGWALAYFESYGGAVDGTAPIPAGQVTAYQNTSNPQVIYVRATDPVSLCFEIVELELVVDPLPDDSAAVAPYIACAADGSEIAVFDLEAKVPEILGGQASPPFAVSFYLDPLDAEQGTNAIVNTTTYQNMDAGNNPVNPQTIYTGILDTRTGCYIGGVQSFELIVQPGAIAVSPAGPFVVCDNLAPSDGFAEFDLEDVADQQVSDLRAGILAGQDPSVFRITFHETQEGAQTGQGAIVFPYVNLINPQRVYARVTNTQNLFEPQCYAVAEVVLKVESLPEIVLEGGYRLCVDANGNPVPEEAGGPSPPVIDTGLDPGQYTFQWALDGVMLPGQTGPSIVALQGGAYTVTVTELASGCDAQATATVTVSSPPLAYGAVLVNGAFAGTHVIEVEAEGQGTYEYQLDNGPFQDGNRFEGVAPGDHTVTIRDKFGCGSVTIDVGVIDYPPYFTPNGDGYHDTWNIIGIASGDPAARIYVFDRFGKLLKQLSPTGPGWDGTYNGSPMPSSDYWFRVEYREQDAQKEFKGHFTLKR
jgi:gliding motility-associated-like protein